MRLRPVIALVATPKFKIAHKRDLQHFVCKHLYTLTSHFDVISTGRTYGEISEFLEKPELWHQLENRSLIQESFDLTGPEDLQRWRRSIHGHFLKKRNGIEGMIEIAHELVTGWLEAIIQLSVEDDTTVRAGSAVLRREANVHDVPIASDLATAISSSSIGRTSWNRMEAMPGPCSASLKKLRHPVRLYLQPGASMFWH
jgi:methylglyoxal synthase